MMMKVLLAALAVAISTTRPAAQDAVAALPDSYSIQFENEWVKVVRVYYAPHATLPAHTHNVLPAAYVYLNDSGPVRFTHIGTSYGAATRPPTKAGAFRVFRGIDEIHGVENTSALPSHFLRIEFKTAPRDLQALKGRFFREPATDGEHVEKVQFDNGQVRISRVICAPGRPMRLATTASEPALLIALQPAQLRDATGGDVIVRVGEERWMRADTAIAFENRGAGPGEFLRFDFKTAPIDQSAGRAQR